jgi:3-phenylpropionate/trans-cinnamate dioxygenase ferredoxin reductase subunit
VGISHLKSVSIVGASHAGVEAAARLRSFGFDGDIRLIDAQDETPYERPPLSKAFLCGEKSGIPVPLKPAAFFSEARIETIFGSTVKSIDFHERVLHFADGAALRFDGLILATGCQVRRLPEPLDAPELLYLKSIVDARRIREELQSGMRVLIIGGGFIGLEVAASAVTLGCHVTVVEAGPRLMARAVSTQVSAAFHALHVARGVRIFLGRSVCGLQYSRSTFVVTFDDERVEHFERVVVGIGVHSDALLVREAGLSGPAGVAVDARMETICDRVFAIGDCALHANPFASLPLRIESVANAQEQAAVAAANLLGHDLCLQSVPWFWSDQYDSRLQIVGLSCDADLAVERVYPDGGRAIFHSRSGKAVCVELIDRPKDFLAARKLVSAGRSFGTEKAADPGIPLNQL